MFHSPKKNKKISGSKFQAGRICNKKFDTIPKADEFSVKILCLLVSVPKKWGHTSSVH